VLSWEPIRTFDSVNTPWNDVYDMTVTGDQLIACSVSHASVAVWLVNMQVFSHQRVLTFDVL
jgi:hypothetical protein